jgi:hypothetical protein
MTLNSISFEAAQQLVVLYGGTLMGGGTIDGKPVRHSTIKEYLREAGAYLTSIGFRKLDPCKQEDDQEKWFGPLGRMLDDFKRWESEPNRVSPLTCRMVRSLQRMIVDLPEGKVWTDSKLHAFNDWCIVGLNMGYRKCEWAVDTAPKDLASYPLHHADHEGDKGYYNCIGTDFRICDTNGLPIPIEQEDCWPIDQIGASTAKVRWQKNGHNNVELSFARNPKNPSFDVPMAMLRIKQRARRLGLRSDQPLSGYRASRNSQRPSFFCNNTIKGMLQMMASNTYDIPIDQLAEYGLRYTGHSFRVGAAVLMHANGAKEDEIKQRLRWTSACYALYLRQMPKDAINHMRMFNNSDVDDWDPSHMTEPTMVTV